MISAACTTSDKLSDGTRVCRFAPMGQYKFLFCENRVKHGECPKEGRRG